MENGVSLLDTSKNYFSLPAFKAGAAIPVVSTVSSVGRIVGALGLAVFGALKTVFCGIGAAAQLLTGRKVTMASHAADGASTVGYNLGAIAVSAFQAIPIIGNIPSWIKYAPKCVKLTEELMFGGN